MLFNEALKSLLDGNYVTRHGWEDGKYLALMPGMQFIWQVTVVPNPAAGNWLPMVSDLNADDWFAKSKCENKAKDESVVEAPEVVQPDAPLAA